MVRRVRRAKRRASRRVGSERARGRRERRRAQKSVVREGRGRVVGPEAWRRRARVRIRRGRRGGEVRGVVVPLFFLLVWGVGRSEGGKGWGG